jgi:hypothetical protein
MTRVAFAVSLALLAARADAQSWQAAAARLRAMLAQHAAGPHHPTCVASGADHAAGMVPDPGASAGTTKFLREDCTWQVPAGGGGGVSDGDKGDITVTGSGATWTIDGDVITFANIQTIATDRLLGRDTAATGDVEEISLGGGLEFSGSTSIQRSALTGDVTATAGSNTTTVVDDSHAHTGATISALDAADTTAGTFADARVDGSLEADELALAGDVDGTANANDLDEAAVESELESVLDLADLQGALTPAKGGTGDDTSGSTGVPRIASGNWTYDGGVSHLAASTSSDLRGVLSDDVGTGGAMFGLISTMADDLSCTGSQVVRRNAGDTAFECATPAAGGGYATVQEEGGALTQRTILNFLGSSITCVDDGSTKTNCTITGGGGGLDHPAVMSRASLTF